MKVRGQVTLEYVLVIGFAFAIIIPGIYFFSLYSQQSASTLAANQYAKLGQDILATAVETLAQGKGSWTILDTLVPKSVQNITTSSDGKELIITFNTPDGPSDTVFFSDEVNLSGGGVDGSLYASRVHSGRLTLQFYAGSNDVVQVDEVVGDWIAPQCATDDDCYSYAADHLCFYEGSCSQGMCDYTSEDKTGLLACTGDARFSRSGKERQCEYNPPAPHTCTDTGWECPTAWQTDRCPVTGNYSNECWYKPLGVSDECNATGCQLAVDTNRGCPQSVCNEQSGWDNSACVGCVDADGDGYNTSQIGCGVVDCNDTNASIYPGAPEFCADKRDNDCDSNIDELDSTCAVTLVLQPNITTAKRTVVANLTASDGLLYHDNVTVRLCPTTCHICVTPTCTFQPSSSGEGTEAPWLSCTFTAPLSDGLYTYHACLGENQASAVLNVSCLPYYAAYDYNDDEILDDIDSTILKEAVEGQKCLPDKTCDVNGDSTIDIDDVTRLNAIIDGTYDNGENCTDDLDNNCDGLIDGADEACDSSCGGEGEPCCAGKDCDPDLSCCPKSLTCEKLCE